MICDALKGKCCILAWRAELCTWPENMKYGAQARVRSAECGVHIHYNLAFYSTSSSSVSSADYNWPESADLLSFCTQESTTCVQIRQRLLCTCFALRSCRTLHSVLDCVKTSRFATAMASVSHFISSIQRFREVLITESWSWCNIILGNLLESWRMCGECRWFAGPSAAAAAPNPAFIYGPIWSHNNK